MTPVLPANYTMRPITLEDVPAITEMMNIYFRPLVGRDEYFVEVFLRELQEPLVDMTLDTRIILAPDARIVAYREMWPVYEPYVKMYTYGAVLPGPDSAQLHACMLDWVEGRAREFLPRSQADAQVALYAFAMSQDEDNQAAYHQIGMQRVRQSLRMLIDFDTPPAMPEPLPGLDIRPMRFDADLPAVVMAVRDSFRDHWGFVEIPFEQDLARYRQRIATNPHFDPDLWLIAWDGDQIAGISLNEKYFEEDPDMGWVNSLGVLRPWRKRGLGLALLQRSFYELTQRGKLRVGLGVDGESLTGATRLYLKAGMHPDPMHQFNQYRKILRAGVDITTQTLEHA